MIEKILDMALKVAQEAEVFEVESEETPVLFENNKLKSTMTRSTKGYALRIIKDGKIGFSSTTRPDGAEQLVRNAIETAEFGQKAVYQFAEKPTAIPDVKTFDDTVSKMTVEQLVDTGKSALDAILAAEPDAQVGLSVERVRSRQRLTNSRGLDVGFESTHFGAGGGLEMVRGTDMLQVWDYRDSRKSFNVLELTERIIYMAKVGKDVVPIDTRSMPVIFTPKGFGMTFDLPVQIAFNGKEVLQGASSMSNKLGVQEFDPRLSVYDDGTLDYFAGSQPVDDEGIPTSRTPLVEKGVVTGFIYDLQTGARAGKPSTGNGHRGLSSLPSPSYSSFVIEPGDASLEDMIKGIEYGLLVDQTLGAWTGNVRGGDVSGNVHFGLKIEKGEIIGRVKDVMVAGNTFAAMKHLGSIENKAHPIGGVKLPHILFNSLSVAARV